MLSPDEIRERLERVQAEVGPGVTVVAATKYVAARRHGALVEAGVTVVGENRAQDLEAKHAEYGDAFRWHFIGHLQSNKVKVVNRICELVHSLDSDSAARRLEVPALVQVNLAGEGSKSGRRARGDRLVPRLRRARALDDAARGGEPRGLAGLVRRLRELADEHGLHELSMGTTQDYAVAAEEGATYVRVGSILFRD